MSGTLALASAVAEMDRDELRALVLARPPHSPAAVSDPIGLAAELLKPDSIARAIAGLDREHLAVLADADVEIGGAGPAERVARELLGLGLLGRDRDRTVQLPEVTASLTDAFAARGAALEALQTPERDPEHLTAVDVSAWFTAALTAVGQAAECLRSLRDRPGKLNRSGSIAVATLKQLSEATGVVVDDVALALGALLRAGLIVPLASDHLLVASARSGEWLRVAHTARWIQLAAAAVRAIPPELRMEWDRGGAERSSLTALAASIPLRYPLLPAADLESIGDFVRAAEYLGLTHEGRLTPVANKLLGGGAVEDEVASAMPATAAGVYVQPDLSVVVPGPLEPDDEAIISTLARAEHIGVASTRRISEASITEAYERGLTPGAAREAFSRVSVTGIPQPLDYLLSSIGSRVGGIVVGEHSSDVGRTRISVARAELANALLVDRALHHLQLQRSDESETELFSRLSADHVLAALADARYHASSHDAALHEVVPRLEAAEAQSREPSASATSSSVSPAEEAPAQHGPAIPTPLEELVDRVYSAARSEPGTGDFTRRLELAIRDRSPVQVTAEARGQVRTFTLLPVSVSAGRLRAADQTAGVERTIPVSMITSVEPT